MANLTKALIYTLANEGGFVDNPKDKGGATNKGITLRTYSQYCSSICTVEQLKSISDEQVCDIYNCFYWIPLKLNQVKDDSVATAIFDMGVNMGTHEAAELTQLALSWFSVNASIGLDGVMGPNTLDALNNTDPDLFITFFANAVDKHYRDICKADITQVAFLGGWLKRAQRLLTLKENQNG